LFRAAIQADYEQWLDTLPASLAESATAGEAFL
jgi:hypothetical protein